MEHDLTIEQLKRELEILTDKVVNFQTKPKPRKKSTVSPVVRVSSGKYGSSNFGNNDNTIKRTALWREELSYKGYMYLPVVKDGIISHDIYDRLDVMSAKRLGDNALPKFSNASIPNVGNEFLTFEQFKNFIDTINHITYNGR